MGCGTISEVPLKRAGFQCVLGEENTLYTNEGRTAGMGRVYPATKNYATINCIGLFKLHKSKGFKQRA